MMKRIFTTAIHEKRMRLGNTIWVSEPAAVKFSDVRSVADASATSRGATDAEVFRAYVRRVLCPTLRKGDVVIHGQPLAA